MCRSCLIVAVLTAVLSMVGPAQAQQTFFIDTVAGPRGLHAYRPNSVAVASDGTVYMSDPTHNSVFRVAADGTLFPFAGPGEGQAGFGGDNGPAAVAQLGGPSGLAVASDGSLYIADRLNHRIRKVDGTTGIITTVVGTGTIGDSGDNGQATAAQLYQPIGVTVTSDGTLYIADAFNHRIRKVDATTGIITTVAGTGTGGFSGDGGPATAAQLNYPTGVAVASNGTMYIADWNNHRVRKVASDGTITTVAGTGTGGYSGDDGQADAAQLNNPYGVLVTADGNTVYIADWSNHRVRKVDVSIATPTITTVAGTGAQESSGDGGPATEAEIIWPTGVAVDGAGNLYLALNGVNRQGSVRKVDATTGIITTLTGGEFHGFSGDGGLATKARLWGPTDVVVDGAGNLYIADRVNYRIRKVDTTGIITTIAGGHETCHPEYLDCTVLTASGFSGDGDQATAAQLSLPMGVALTADDSTLYIADENNHRIRKVVLATGIITTVAGSGTSNDENAGGFSGDNGQANAALLNNPEDVAVDSNGNLYIADTENHRIRKVTAATGIISTVAGTGSNGFSGDGGLATDAQLSKPIAVAVDASDNLYIADTFNHRIRKVTAATGIITTIAGGHETCDTSDPPECTVYGFSGDGGQATAAQLDIPQGVVVARDGTVYIADTNNERIRKVATDGVITTIAGGVFCTNPAEDTTCVDRGFRGDGGPAAMGWFNTPLGIALASDGAVYVSDLNNDRVRVLASSPPTANADSATARSGTAATINVLANDTDPNNATLRVIAVTDPPRGRTQIVSGYTAVRYTSNSGFTGTDTFTYTISNGKVTDTATVTVTVTPPPPRPPTTTGGGGGGSSRDDHGNTPARATAVSPDETAPWNSSTPGQINSTRDVDHFTFTVPHAGVLVVETTGSTDTVGTVWQGGEELGMADSGGVRRNFWLSVRVEAGPVVIAVEGAGRRTGSYTLQTTLVAGYLENPGPNSFQSGVGVIAGWVCEADTVEIELETELGEVHRYEAGYGTERLDTDYAPDGTAICGDTDNGFGLLFNWNRLGDGTHEVVARVDGIELGRATVTVTTLGVEFLQGAEGACEAEDFPSPGERVPLMWQQSSQNFVLAEGPQLVGIPSVPAASLTGVLENPAPYSFQSGIGVISGWVCEAEVVEIELGHLGRQVAAYGTERVDTAYTEAGEMVCGDTDNGFGLLFNWNRLGAGEHVVVARVDGIELGRTTVRVTRLGTNFLENVTGTCEATDFPETGQTVTLTWQEAQQNFVITNVK